MLSKLQFIQKDLSAYLFFLGYKLKKILSFKVSFYSQAIFMMVNNAFLLGAWWLLFQNFGSINGYSFKEIIFIQGYIALWYAIGIIMFEGLLDFGDILNKDALLNYQLYPVSTLAVILARGKSLSVYGDLLWGIILLAIYFFLAGDLNFWVLVLCLVVSTFAMFGFFLLINSLLFFLPNVVTLQNFIFEIFLGSGFYPSQNFTGFVKIILWLIPVFPIVFIPLEISHNFLSIQNLIYTFLVAILLNLIGFWLWNKGLAQAESGNQAGSVE